MGLIIGKAPELAAEEEPDSAGAYFDAAVTILDEQSSQRTSNPSDVRTHFTWANLLVLCADVAAAALSDDDASPIEAVRDLLKQGSVHFELALKAATQFQVEPLTPSTTLIPHPGEDEKTDRLPQLTTARIHGYLGLRLWDVIDQLDESFDKAGFPNLEESFTFALEGSMLPHENDAKFAGLMGQGKTGLAKAARLLAEHEGSEDGASGDSDQASPEQPKTNLITALDQGIFQYNLNSIKPSS